jgi:hypothetical protein
MKFTYSEAVEESINGGRFSPCGGGFKRIGAEKLGSCPIAFGPP